MSATSEVPGQSDTARAAAAVATIAAAAAAPDLQMTMGLVECYPVRYTRKVTWPGCFSVPLLLA